MPWNKVDISCSCGLNDFIPDFLLYLPHPGVAAIPLVHQLPFGCVEIDLKEGDSKRLHANPYKKIRATKHFRLQGPALARSQGFVTRFCSSSLCRWAGTTANLSPGKE